MNFEIEVIVFGVHCLLLCLFFYDFYDDFGDLVWWSAMLVLYIEAW